MIRDEFLEIQFPNLPKDHQDRSQTESLKTETETPKSQTSFLTLPSELRQDILIRTYHIQSTEAIQRWNDPTDTGRTWLQTRHKTNINTWVKTLHSVNDNIIDDVDYIKTKWLQEVERLPPTYLPHPQPQKWSSLSETDRKAIWTLTQTSEEPWRRIHRKLYLYNRNWYHSKISKDSSFIRGTEYAAHPPWDKQGGPPRTYVEYVVKWWRQGPSRIVWKENSRSHHPSTWERLLDAVDGDIAWIVRTENEYQRELVDAEIAAASGDAPGLFSRIKDCFARFWGLY